MYLGICCVCGRQAGRGREGRGQRKKEERGLDDILMGSASLPNCFVENVPKCVLPKLRIKVEFLKLKTHKLFFSFVSQVLDLV